MLDTPTSPVKLTRKQQIFVKEIIDNPKQSNTDAAMKAFNSSNRRVAGVTASRALKMPAIKMALAEHNDLFESAIVGTVEQWKDNPNPRQREIATQNAQYAYDHIHGKSTVKVEQQVSVVRININLTGDGQDDPPTDLLDLTEDDVGVR